MYYLVHKAPAYTAGYQYIDAHVPWHMPHLRTAPLSAHDEDYLDAMLPIQLSLNLDICPVPLIHAPRAFLQYKEITLPSRILYPKPEHFVSGLTLKSDGCGSYMKHGTIHLFKDFCVEGAALQQEEQVVHHKFFHAQATDVSVTQGQSQGYSEIFPYAGSYNPTDKIEDLCQHYAALRADKGTFKIETRSAQGWEDEGYTLSLPVPSLGHDILNGHVQVCLVHSGAETRYRSMAYQQLDGCVSKVLVHFLKTI